MAINGKGRPTKEQAAQAKRVHYWEERIAEYKRAFGGEKWESRVEKILRKYRGDDETKGVSNPTAKFNILWSNVQTLVPATFSRLPQPDVSRRFRDNDPVGRVAALILERALDFEINNYPDYRATMRQSVQDRFLGGRGTAWARYEPHIRAKALDQPEDGESITEDVDDPEEELEYECAPIDYVHWKDFGHTVARTWEEVTAVYRLVFLTREACIERFGKEIGESIPLDSTPSDEEGGKRYGSQQDTEKDRAAIYEIWDKEGNCAEWMTRTNAKIIDKITPDDTDKWIDYEGFFPCPRPLYSTLTDASLVPVPDYTLYQDQANTLNVLADRIDGLCRMLQVKGVYDGSADSALGRLFTEGENGTLMPVKNWAAFAEKNGLKGQLDVYDITPIFNALREAYQAMTQQKEQVYEITGISDIVRGQTQASETLGAQEIKKNFVGLRLGYYKEQVALYATEILQLKAQVICSKFDDETLKKIAAVEQLNEADLPFVDQAIALLRSEPMRNFRVDIAADTLVQIDEDAEKQARMEFLQATGAFLEKSLPVVQHSPGAAPLLVTLLKFGVTAFKVGKTIEGAFDQAIDRLAKEAATPKPPPPDPDMERVKADQQAQQMRLQGEQQANAAKLQFEQQKGQMEMAMEKQRMQMEFQLESQRAANDQMFAKFEALLKARTAVEVAEIGAKATLDGAQISAAHQGTEQ